MICCLPYSLQVVYAQTNLPADHTRGFLQESQQEAIRWRSFLTKTFSAMAVGGTLSIEQPLQHLGFHTIETI